MSERTCASSGEGEQPRSERRWSPPSAKRHSGVLSCVQELEPFRQNQPGFVLNRKQTQNSLGGSHLRKLWRRRAAAKREEVARSPLRRSNTFRPTLFATWCSALRQSI